MGFLTTTEFREKLTDEIKKVEEDLHIVSAFCKKEAVSFIDNNLKHVLKTKKLLVRFLPCDIIQGATDLDLFEYCINNGWKLYVRFDLHAKTYIFDKKRYILGSGNLTSKGLGLNSFGNYELAGFSEIEKSDLDKIDSLFSSAIEMTRDIYEEMKKELESIQKNKISHYINGWNKKIEDLFVPNLDVLFTYDFPADKAPSSAQEVYEFLELNGQIDNAILKDKFRWSKAFQWLYQTVNKAEKKECYFGELSEKLHNSLINDPRPYRKEVKELLSNLLGWVLFFDFDFIKIDIPNHSQRIRII